LLHRNGVRQVVLTLAQNRNMLLHNDLWNARDPFFGTHSAKPDALISSLPEQSYDLRSASGNSDRQGDLLADLRACC